MQNPLVRSGWDWRLHLGSSDVAYGLHRSIEAAHPWSLGGGTEVRVTSGPPRAGSIVVCLRPGGSGSDQAREDSVDPM